MIRSILLVSLLLAGGALAQDVTTIRAGKVIIGDGATLDDAEVDVRDGKIVAIRPGAASGASGVLTAGLIDAAASGLLGRGSTEEVSEVVPSWRVLDALDLHGRTMRRLAESGVTTIFATADERSVIGCRGAVVKTLGGVVLVAAAEPKLTLTHAPSGGNSRPGRGHPISLFDRRPTTQMGVNFVARDAFAKAREYAARKPKMRDSDLEVLAEVVSGKLPLRVRAEELYEIATALRLADEWGLEIVLENARDAWRVAGDLAKRKIPVIYGPCRTPARPPVPARFRAMMGRGSPDRPSAPALLLKKGVEVSLTSAGQTGDLGLVAQALVAVRHGLSPADALASVTTRPARLLGVTDRVGMVKVGMDADLVLWNGEPFLPTSRPTDVWVSGRHTAARIY